MERVDHVVDYVHSLAGRTIYTYHKRERELMVKYCEIISVIFSPNLMLLNMRALPYVLLIAILLRIDHARQGGNSKF